MSTIKHMRDKLSTGNESMDKLLDGGVEAGALTNFCGTPGTGKTNVCMLIAIEAIKQGKKVIFIDTEGGFSLERFEQLTSAKSNFLSRIIFMAPKTFREQEEIVKSLDGLCSDGSIGLVILDSAVALYRLEYAETDDVLSANKQLGVQLALLSNLARERKIPVLITSHVFRRFETEKTDIIGGDAIKYWCKTIVFIEKTNELSRRRAVLLKHRSLEEGREVEFYLTQTGIEAADKFKIF